MKATDLMIGDWVTFRDDPNIPIKIWGINEDGTAFAFIDKDRALDEIAIDDEIIGILLTSEILEKNGWVSMRNGSGDFEHLQSPYFSDSNLIITKTTVGYYQMIHGVFNGLSINYVHELQHALKLCGIDKEIRL